MKLFGQTASLFSTTHSVPKAWAESKGWSPSLYHQPWAEKVVSMNFSLAPPPRHRDYRPPPPNRKPVSSQPFPIPFALFKPTDTATAVNTKASAYRREPKSNMVL